MKGYTIQHSIELLEKNAGNGGGGASSAANVSYDNTSSGLAADDVQEAIDELAGKKPINIGSTETQIGTYNGDPLFAKTFSETVSISTAIGTNLYGGDVVDLFPEDAKECLDVLGIKGGYILSKQSAYADGHWTTSFYSIYTMSSVTMTGFILYTKAAPVSKKKKGGK